MAHDPRIFIGQQQAPHGDGHQLHIYSANSNGITAALAQAKQGLLVELTTVEYAAWDAGDRTHKAIEAHGR